MRLTLSWRQIGVALGAASAAALSLGVIPPPWGDIVTVFLTALAGGAVVLPRRGMEGAESNADRHID